MHLTGVLGMKKKAQELISRGYSIDEARGLLGGISRTTMWRMEKAGQIHIVTIRGRRIVPGSEIDRLLSGDKAA